jgi:hypothetical protein
MKNKRPNKSLDFSMSQINFINSPTRYLSPNQTFINSANNSSLLRYNNSMVFNKTKNSILDTKYIIPEQVSSYGEYNKSLNKIMEDYKYDAEQESVIRRGKRRNNRKATEDEETIKQLLKKNNISLYKKKLGSQEAQMRINVSHEDFGNPYQSLEILTKNKLIYDSMLCNYRIREVNKFEESIKKIDKEDKLANKFNNSAMKVKVTSIMPKSMDINPNSTNIKFDSNIVLPNVGIYNLKKDASNIELYSYFIYPQKNFPEGREQFSISNDSNEIVLFGGIVSNKNNNIWSLDPVNLEWRKITAEFSQANPRYGHTGVLFQKKLFVFGGKTKSQNYFYIPDLEIFGLEDRQWSTPSLFTKGTLKLRRNHIAIVIGHHMFVHGGISEEEEYLSDSFILTLSPSLKWNPCAISSDFEPPTLAWHSVCLVLPSDQRNNPKTNIYKIPEQNIGRRTVSRVF